MGKFNRNKFASSNQEWETPSEIFAPLNKEFNFDWDLAASRENTKCHCFWDKESDSLSGSWVGKCWLNPPFKKIGMWVRKAYEDSEKFGSIIVMLAASRTNTSWWHNYCMKAKEIRFIKGRPKFKGAKHGLPLPLSIIIFEKHSGKTKYGSFNMGNSKRKRE